MRKFTALVLAGIMVFSLAACGSSSSSGSTTAAETEAAAEAEAAAADTSASQEAAAESTEPVSLTFWYWADSTENSETIQNAVAAYNESNGKGITVTAQEYAWNSGGFTEDIFTAIMGGGGPDLSTFKSSSGNLFMANGLLADMTSYVEAWEDKDQIGDSSWEIMKTATSSDTYSILPWTMESLYVYYRPSIFEAAGVEVPTTFDEFMEVVEKCTMDTDGDGKTDVYGFGMRGAGGGQEHLGNFLYPCGATWDDLTTPEAVEAYKKYLSIYENGWAPEASVNAAYAEIKDEFATGQVAMIIHHIGSSNEWEALFGDDCDAFVFPGSEKGQWTCGADTDFVVYESCENKDAAWDFYTYMVTGDGGTAWFKDTGKGLGTDNITATEEYSANKYQAISAAAAQVGGILPCTETVSEFINNTWTAVNQSALLGQISAEEALAEMQESLHGN